MATSKVKPFYKPFYVGSSNKARDAEMGRFNRLSQTDAKQFLNEVENKQTCFRSCWYCNSAHEHLKEADYPFYCLGGCALAYFRGFPILMLTYRAKGTTITEDMMQQFEHDLARRINSWPAQRRAGRDKRK